MKMRDIKYLASLCMKLRKMHISLLSWALAVILGLCATTNANAEDAASSMIEPALTLSKAVMKFEAKKTADLFMSDPGIFDNDYTYTKTFSNDYLSASKSHYIDYRLSDLSRIFMTASKSSTYSTNSKEISQIRQKGFNADLIFQGTDRGIINLSLAASKLKHYSGIREYESSERTYKNASFLTGYRHFLGRGMDLKLGLGTSFASIPDDGIRKYSFNWGLCINKSFEFSKISLRYAHGLINDSSNLDLFEAHLSDRLKASYLCNLFGQLNLRIECGFVFAGSIRDNPRTGHQNMLLASSSIGYDFSKNAKGEIRYSYINDGANPFIRASSSASFNISYKFF